jgi:hypothetical protein
MGAVLGVAVLNTPESSSNFNWRRPDTALTSKALCSTAPDNQEHQVWPGLYPAAKTRYSITQYFIRDALITDL